MKFNKQQWQWIFYDWANSGYGILVVTAVLPVYFKAAAHQNGISAALSTALWGYANSAGTLVVSFLSPFLGAMADYTYAKRRWLKWFAYDDDSGGFIAKCLAMAADHICFVSNRLFRRQPFL